ncbi:23S rRNA (guanosine(2251)-2'-O)-methyltransferase RlmB [Candidatus Omnitrophota bacterium]
MAKDSMYLYGKNSILERLKIAPKTIKKISLQKNFDAPHILNLIDSIGIHTERVSEKELAKIKRADRLQGIVAEVDKFQYADFEELLNRRPDAQSDERLSFICLDNLNDPHNLGSIIRISACFGGFAVIIPRHRSCEVTDAVMHVASGGENFIPVSMVTNMTTALIKAKDAGYWIVGAVVENGEDINNRSLPFPICLVLGSEGKGIRHGIDKHLDLKSSLPMKGAALSFNVAMACAIFCHEIAKQRCAGRKV